MGRSFVAILVVVLVSVLGVAVAGGSGSDAAPSREDRVVKTVDEWKAELTPEEFHILREKGTERAFTGEYHDSKEPGVYRCVCCGQALFSSAEKYDSGTGWPSFWRPADPDAVDTESHHSQWKRRTEVLSSACGAHRAHALEDGPAPAGQR